MKIETRKTLMLSLSAIAASLVYGISLFMIYPILKSSLPIGDILSSSLVVILSLAVILFWAANIKQNKSNRQNVTTLFLFLSTIITFMVVG